MTSLDIATHMSEKQLQQSIINLAKWYGWRTYHTYDSRRSTPGFPDLTMVSAKRGRVIFAELKKTGGRTTQAQRDWLDDLHAAGQEAYLWYPNDWVDGTIRDTLK